ncbi:MAG: MFS transporter [Bacteroidales bacterium]|nr:MFS transporter [Bacteroidales bacterium]
MSKQKNYLIVGLIMLTFFVVSFLTNILGALNPSVSQSFALSETMAGFLPFSFFIAYGVMSIPAGFLVEKYGEKRLMIVAFIMAFMASLVFAGLPSFTVYLISLFTIGAGMAILQVVINPLLRVTGGEENYAFTSVMAQLIFGLASFVSPQLYSWLVVGLRKDASEDGAVLAILRDLVPADMSWISMYWVFAVFSLVMVLIILSFKFPKIELQDDEKAGTKNVYIGLFKNRLALLYFLGIFAYVGAEQGISYWMSKFLNEYHGFDYETIGANAVAYFWGLMTIGGMFGLVLLRFLDSKIVLRWFTIAAIFSLAIALFGPAQMSYYSFMMSGFFLAVMYPVIVSLGLNSVKKHHGAFAGILMTGIMGGAVVQLIVGFISDIASLRIGMSFVFVTLAYILSISFWSKPIITNKTIKLKELFSK